MKKFVVITLLLLGTGALGLKNYFQQSLQLVLPYPNGYLEIKPGDNLSALCAQWQQAGWLQAADCQRLKIQSVLQPELRQLKAGVYPISSSRVADVLALVRAGKVAQFSLQLLEGQTLAQNFKALADLPYLQQDVADIAALQQRLQWPADWGVAVNAEGLLLPETYFYTGHSRLSAVLLRAHKALLQQVEQHWQTRAADLPLKTPYELLILASIIEKESSHLPEKPLVASVFVNRLRQNMRLQTDPTVIYGLGERYQGDIKREHLKDPHPYNTYVHNGLPPGPISLISSSSLQAAAQPAVSDKLYFVAKGDGTHQFSSTLAEHNAAVQQYIFGKKP